MGRGSLTLKHGLLHFHPWIDDFNPMNQKSTNAQIWVRFYSLPREYWHPKILASIAKGIGIPLKIDKGTINGNW